MGLAWFCYPRLLFTYRDGKKYPEMVISMTFQMNSKLYSLWIICSEKNFQWKKWFLMVHMVWRWGNSFCPYYGVAKSVKLRCNLPWRHSIKLDSRPHYELRSTNATNHHSTLFTKELRVAVAVPAPTPQPLTFMTLNSLETSNANDSTVLSTAVVLFQCQTALVVKPSLVAGPGGGGGRGTSL